MCPVALFVHVEESHSGSQNIGRGFVQQERELALHKIGFDPR